MENFILSLLSKTEIGALPLREVELEQGQLICAPGALIDKVWFPRGSVISLVATLSDGQHIEAATVGREGVIGASAALDGSVSLSKAIVQTGGLAATCAPEALKSAALKSENLLSVLIRHEQALYAQAQQIAACNISHQIEARLARWMLRARDLSQSDTLSFTQEFLAEMLGVQRSSVSLAAHSLQQAGLIEYTRANIRIVNSAELRHVACECYETILEQYESLFDADVHPARKTPN